MIRKDIYRSGFRSSTEIERVLVALLNFAPHIGYIPGGADIAAFLLQQTTPENTFWIMAGLMTKFLPRDYFDRDVLSQKTEAMLNQLLAKDPELHVQLDGYGRGELCVKWFATLFANTLSLEATADIWDAMFEARDPVAFLEEVGANLLLELQPRLSIAKDINDARNVLMNAPLELVDFPLP